MAQGDTTLFPDGLKNALKNWAATDTLKCAVLDPTTTPTSEDVDPELADYTQVGAGGSYTAGGSSLGTWGDFVTQAGGVVTLDSSTNPTWAQHASNDTDARWLVIYNDTQAGDPCLAFVDLGANFDMTAAPLTANWAASGIVTLQVG